MASPVYPEEGDSAEIGRLALRCFHNHRPGSWIDRDLSGTDDFGFDLQIQVKVGMEVRHIFRSQLKGSKSTRPNAAGTHFPVELKTSTLNLYLNSGDPVLLMFADLSVDDDERNCPIYYAWIHDEIRQLAGEADALGDGQKTHTLHVPIANKLSRETDLTGDLNQFSRYRLEAGRLGSAIDLAMPHAQPEEKLTVVKDVRRAIALGQFPSSAVNSPNPWPQAAPNSIARRLQDATTKLDHGDLDSFQKLLTLIEAEIDSASQHELAEFRYLKGRYASVFDEEQKASEHFLEADKLYPEDTKYVVALADARFRDMFDPDKSFDHKAILDLFTRATTPEADQLRVRILASASRFDEAFEIAARLPKNLAYAARGVLGVMQRDWAAVLEATQSGISDPELSDRAIANLRLFKTRALFHLAMGEEFEGGPEDHVPTTGPSKVDIEGLRKAWEEAQQCLREHERIGWPPSVSYLVDLVAMMATIFGEEEKVLPQLRELSLARPNLDLAHQALQHVAMNAGDVELSLTAMSRRKPSPDIFVQEVGVLYKMKNFHKAVERLSATLSEIPDDHRWLPMTLSIGALSAQAIFNKDAEDRFTQRLEAIPNAGEFVALHRYFVARHAAPEIDDSPAEILRAALDTYPDSIPLLVHLLQTVNAGEKAGATEYLTLAKRISANQQLDLEQTLGVAQAYITMRMWPELEAFASASIKKFDFSSRLKAIWAFSLDQLGQTERAIQALDQLFDEGCDDRIALDTFTKIAVRIGLVDQACTTIEKLLSKETRHDRRIHLLSTLANLRFTSNPSNAQAYEIVRRLGKEVNQKDEEEEALFLTLFTTTTITGAAKISEEDAKDFHSRVEAFSKQFPNSKRFISLQLPTAESGLDPLEAIRAATGRTDKHDREIKRRRNQLERGAPVPYSYRPKRVLQEIPDIASLWTLSRLGSEGNKGFNLTIHLQESKLKLPTSRTLQGRVPIIDLTTLLVIHYLKLFDVLFKIFPKVIIPRSVSTELMQIRHPMSGSFGFNTAIEIIGILQENLSRVQQPAAISPAEADPLDFAISNTQELEALCQAGTGLLYCDDELMRILASEDRTRGVTMSTVDLLVAADELGLLTPYEVGVHLTSLCRVNAGITVMPRYLLAVVKEELPSLGSPDKVAEAIRVTPNLAKLLDSLWFHGKDVGNMAGHLAGLIQHIALTSTDSASLKIPAALWAFWHIKVSVSLHIGNEPKELLAQVFALVAAKCTKNGDSALSRKLWQIYIYAAEAIYGSRMDEAVERAVRKEAGRHLGHLTLQAETGTKVEGTIDFVKSALTEGTTEYSAFTEGYQGELMRSVTKDKRG